MVCVCERQMDSTTTIETKETKEKIRVLVVDDHDPLRLQLMSMLTHELDMTVVGGACNGREALQKIRDLHPHVVLMDVFMPIMDGIETTARITMNFPGVWVLALSHSEQGEYIRRMMNAGAVGYIVKGDVEELKPAIRKVHGGGRYFSKAIALDQAERVVEEDPGTKPATVVLTPREREVLRFLISGRSIEEIADTLQIDVRTVEFHRLNLCEKMGVHDTLSLVQYAICHKL